MLISSFAPVRLRIADDRDDITIKSVPVSGDDPVVCREFDPGAAEIRDYQTPMVGVDGVVDESAFTGARTLSFDLIVKGDDTVSAYRYIERLCAFTYPGRRPYLYASRAGMDSGGRAWRMRLRGNPFSITYGRMAASLLELQLAFTAPGGHFESADLLGKDISSVYVAGSALTFPLEFPFSFGVTGDTTYAEVSDVIGGSVPTSPSFDVYGPSTGQSIQISTDRGQIFVINNVVLGSGEYVRIDMGTGTVRVQGDPARSVYHLVDWRQSTFWRLWPGPILFRSLGGTLTKIRWRNKRLTI